jgi:hypothetical protein
MALSIKIDELDSEFLCRLQNEAARRGVDIITMAKILIEEGLHISKKATTLPPYHDLDCLAGAWSEAEAASFAESIKRLEQIDDDSWK